MKATLGKAATFATALILAACDGDFAKSLDYGQIQPNFRFEVNLGAPTERGLLYRRFRDVAAGEGFDVYSGRTVRDPSFPGVANSTRSFNWMPSDQSAPQYRLRFSWQTTESNDPDRFTVIVINDDMNSFDVREWKLFARWRDKVLPTAFPDATITVSRHPAEFTSPLRIEEIARSSGEMIPKN